MNLVNGGPVGALQFWNLCYSKWNKGFDNQVTYMLTVACKLHHFCFSRFTLEILDWHHTLCIWLQSFLTFTGICGKVFLQHTADYSLTQVNLRTVLRYLSKHFD